MKNRAAMTEGTEWKLILLFTLPIMAGNFLQQLYNAVDGVIVGNYVSEAAFTAVGACHPLVMLFLGLSIGMSAGCSILISQYYGANALTDLRKAVSTSLFLMGGLGLFLSIAGGVVARWLMAFVLRVPESLLAEASAYFSIYCLGLIFQFIYNGVAAILRSIGDSKATLYFLAVSALTNVLLDLLFVIAFGLGVVGVAIATVMAQALSAAVSLLYMFRRYELFRFQKGEFRFYRDKGLIALKLGVPTTLQQSVVSLGTLTVQRLINSFGETVMGAFTAGFRIQQFITIPLFAFSIGISTFTGQNVGAKKLDRVSSGLRQTLVMSLAVCICLAGLSCLFADPLVSLFGLTGETQALGVRYLRDVAPLLVLFTLHHNLVSLLQGAGDVRFTAATTLVNLAVRVVMSYTLALCTPLAFRGTWLGMPFGWLTGLTLSILRYRSGVWKTKSLVKKEEFPYE